MGGAYAMFDCNKPLDGYKHNTLFQCSLFIFIKVWIMYYFYNHAKIYDNSMCKKPLNDLWSQYKHLRQGCGEEKSGWGAREFFSIVKDVFRKVFEGDRRNLKILKGERGAELYFSILQSTFFNKNTDFCW